MQIGHPVNLVMMVKRIVVAVFVNCEFVVKISIFPKIWNTLPRSKMRRWRTTARMGEAKMHGMTTEWTPFMIIRY